MTSNGRSNRSVGIFHKGPFKVLVCLVTLWSFLFSTIAYDLAWAARTPSELTTVGFDRAGSPGFVKKLHVDTFALPEYLGHIKDSYMGKSDKIVIHIQDAHCNYAAQHKIAEIIEYLSKGYGINAINLEGGAKDYDLSIFSRINDGTTRNKVADYFVREGLVNGAEYSAINNPQKLNLWGIEDPKLYIDNLTVYRESLKYKDEVDKDIKALSYIIDSLKAKIYSPKLLDFDTKYSQYKESKLEFKTYLSYLIETAKQKVIDIKSFKNLYLLSQTLIQEGDIDFKKTNNERDELIDRLQKRLSKNEIEELVLKIVEFKSEKISQKDFYVYLASKAKSINLELKQFPGLQKYIVYISVYSAIDKIAVMDEVDNLEKKIKEALYRNDDEKKLNKLSKNLTLLKSLFNISLTPDDYKYYKANESSFGASNYTSFINRMAPIHHITAKFDGNITNLDKYREDAVGFYECSFKRDAAFIRNIKFQEKTASQNRRNSILITGGFHTENLHEMFKKQDISYISIMPNFRNGPGYECPYFKLLSGKYNAKNIETNAKKVLGLALATTGVLNNLSDAKLHDAVARVCRSAMPQTSTAVPQPVVVSAKPPAVVARPEMRTVKELAQDFHFGGNEAALLLWVDQVSKMSGKSQDQVIAELSKNAETSGEGAVVRYGDIPEERWIYMLSMAKMAHETGGMPLFVERGMHPYAALWPQLRRKLSELGISVRGDSVATKLVDNAQTIVKEFSPDKRLSVVSAALLTLLTPEERARVITKEEKKVLRKIWIKMAKPDQEIANVYLRAWSIGSFDELLMQERLTVGLLVKYLADAGIAPEFTRIQFQVEAIYKILSHDYDEVTVQSEGLPTYASIRSQLLNANRSFHPLLQFSDAEIRELDEIFKAAGLAQGDIQRDSDNFNTSKLWLSFIQGFRERRKQHEFIRSTRHVVAPILTEVLKGASSLHKFQENPLLIFDDAAGTGTAIIASKLVAEIISPQTQPRTGLFVVNKSGKSPPFPVDFSGNINQVYPFEDRSELYSAFYETRANGIDEFPVIVRTTYDELRSEWFRSVENIPDRQRLYEQYLASIQELIKNHDDELFGSLQYLSRARKSIEFDLRTEIIKAYFRGQDDPVYKLLFPGFFASYTGELDRIDWGVRSKIKKDIDLVFTRMREIEESGAAKAELSQLRSLESQVGPLDKARTIEKLQKLYQEEIGRQNDGLSLLDDPRIVQAVKSYFMDGISFDELKKEIMSLADFNLFRELSSSKEKKPANKRPDGSPAECLEKIMEYCGHNLGKEFSAQDLIGKGLRKKTDAKTNKKISLSHDTVNLELRQLNQAGVLDMAKGVGLRYMLRADIRNLSPPQLEKVIAAICAIPELNHYRTSPRIIKSLVCSQAERIIKIAANNIVEMGMRPFISAKNQGVISRILKIRKQAALEELAKLPGASFSEAFAEFQTMDRSKLGMFYRLEVSPTIEELHQIAMFDGEITIAHIRGTRQWVMGLFELKGNRIGEGPFFSTLLVSDLVDLQFHNHPKSRVHVPSFGDFIYGTGNFMRLFLVLEEGLVEFNADSLVLHDGNLLWPGRQADLVQDDLELAAAVIASDQEARVYDAERFDADWDIKSRKMFSRLGLYISNPIPWGQVTENTISSEKNSITNCFNSPIPQLRLKILCYARSLLGSTNPSYFSVLDDAIKNDPDNRVRYLVNNEHKQMSDKFTRMVTEAFEESRWVDRSLIGKFLDRNGKVITSFNIALKDDDKAVLVQYEGETLAEAPIATDVTVDKTIFVEKLKHFFNFKKANLPPHLQLIASNVIDMISSVGNIIALKPHKDVKAAFYEENGQYTLYLNKDILNNPLALIHELGEGSLKLPIGYKNLSRHTVMRGVGKDVRNAFDALDTAKVSEAKTASELIKMLEWVMKKEDFAMSNNRPRESPITRSEKDLIRLNFKNGLKGKEALFGIQDFLTIEGNAKFTQDIQNINRDLRQGVLNIFLMRSRIDTKSAETSIGREIGRKLEKNLGVNTHMLYFEDNDGLAEQLAKAVDYATAQENKDKLPKIFVDCLTQDDWNTVNAFKDSKRQEFPSIDSIIAVGRDFIEGEAPRELPDEVKVILVGSAIMNDRRLKDDFKMSSENLIEGRRRIIDFLMSNRIIDQVTITNDQIDTFFNDLWKGIKRLLITRINWKEFQDWKDSQDEVLRAL